MPNEAIRTMVTMVLLQHSGMAGMMVVLDKNPTGGFGGKSLVGKLTDNSRPRETEACFFWTLLAAGLEPC